MQYAMQIFETDEHEDFRVIDRNGEPWFILSDVCRSLGVGNTADAAKRVDDDDKGIVSIDTLGGLQRKRIINESGLYSLILGSRKPEAKRFKKWVTSKVLPSIRKTGSYGRSTPAFIKRYSANWDRVDTGHFSILNELVIHLWGRLEHAGHILADRSPDGTENRPDISAGRCFSDWLKKKHPDVANEYSFYIHTTPEWEGEVRQYPNSMLALFREFLDAVWIPQYAPNYLRKRDVAALPYLQKLLPSANKPKIGMMRNPANSRFKRVRKAG